MAEREEEAKQMEALKKQIKEVRKETEVKVKTEREETARQEEALRKQIEEVKKEKEAKE